MSMPRWQVRARVLRWCLAAMVVVPAALVQAQARAETSGVMELTLEGALAKGTQACALTIHADCLRDAWSDGWAENYQYNRSIHPVTITPGQASDQRLALTFTVDLQGDTWGPGGKATYQVELTRSGSTLTGTYSGSCENGKEPQKVQGKATGEWLPANPPAAGFVPPKAGEHPRLLFRRAELPGLKEKMKTPLGQGITGVLASSEDGAALGLMYQLTGDKAYADRAAEAARKTMAETGGGPFAIGRVWGYRVLAVAYPYDLCYDAWTPEFRQTCETYMDKYAHACLYNPPSLGRPNMHPGSNFMNVMYGGAATASLALWGEKGPEEAKPRGLPAALDTGGGSARWAAMAWRGAKLNYLNIHDGMGDGGFQSEGESYTLECAYVTFDHALAYRNFTGKSLTDRPDLSHFVPRYLVTTIQDKNPPTPGRWVRAVNQSYGRGDGTAEFRYVTRAFPLCPKQWQPALLNYWLKGLGVSAQDLRTEAAVSKLFARPTGKALRDWVFNDTTSLVFMFLYYPLDMEPQSPETLLPHAWAAPTKGFYAFRDHWKGPEDIVAQIFAKDGPHVGWSQSEAGCFQIYGLGQTWAWKDNEGGPYGKMGSRWQDNVVMLPEDPIDAGAGGRTTYFAADTKANTGSVTFNLDNVYRGLRKNAEGKMEPFDAGIRGSRSFAADYSGKSGAPALFAVADKITGGHKKVWLLQVPRTPNRGQPPKVEIAGNNFVVRQGDASLKATFLSPKAVSISQGKGAGANPASAIPDARGEAIQASAGEDGPFFVVLTLQKGDAPAVQAGPDGLSATVGQQTVRFDGQNIVMGR